MTDFIHSNSVITENGEIVEQKDAPIIQHKKLNGQGTLYKLTDANVESINAEREKSSIVDIQKFIRAVRSNFGPGDYNVNAILHAPLPYGLDEMGVLRVELNSKISITENQHYWNSVEQCIPYIYMLEGVVLELDSWIGFIRRAGKDQEVSDKFVELCEMIVDQTPGSLSNIFDETMFDEHLEEIDKINITRERIYD